MFVKNKGIKNKKSMICCYSDTWALALKNLAKDGLSVLSAAWESSFSNRFVIFYKYQQTSHENQTIKQLILLQWKPKDHLFQILAGSTQMFTIFLAIGYSFQWHLFIICCKKTTTTTATTLQPNTNSSNNNSILRQHLPHRILSRLLDLLDNGHRGLKGFALVRVQLHPNLGANGQHGFRSLGPSREIKIFKGKKPWTLCSWGLRNRSRLPRASVGR